LNVAHHVIVSATPCEETFQSGWLTANAPSFDTASIDMPGLKIVMQVSKRGA
jgi:hypothetical protein